MSVRILIVEDEPLIAADLQGLLVELGYVVSGHSSNALDALSEVLSNPPDLILLDINLGEGSDGIELAQKINEKAATPFIFVTSHSDSTTMERVKAVRPSGFVIKPFNANSLRTQIEIGLARYAANVETSVAPAEEQRSDFVIRDSIFVREKGKLARVAMRDILYAKADDNYVTLFTPTKRYVLVSTLKGLEEKLESPHHLRVHRSYLIDTRQIVSVEDGYVRIGKEYIPVGKTKKEELMARIKTL